MAQAVIFLLPKDEFTGNGTSIVDTTTNIDALWATASVLVGGFMDFTSYQAGLYARFAQGYTSPKLTPSGTFTGKGTANGAQTFSVGGSKVGQIGASLPVDGNPDDIATIEIRVNEIRAALLNLSNVQPSS